MDNYILQTLITQGRIVTSAEIDPDNSYLQIGVYQRGNRKSKAANDAYPLFAIPLSEVGGPIGLLGTSLYSKTPAAGSDFSINHGIFFGLEAGLNSSTANYSIFLGKQSGANATDAYESNFIGLQAGANLSNSYQSNFIGTLAGYSASYSSASNFIGSSAGFNADFCANSNFIGNNAGYGALGSSGSNFIGEYAGRSWQEHTLAVLTKVFL